MTYQVVLSTLNDKGEAERLAHALLEARLIACANIVGPMTSLYRWQGSVEQDTEYLLVMKTAASEVEGLIARISDLHPYEVPEVIALPIAAGAPPYLAWITESIHQ